jgi:hypothetical protein
VRPIPSLTFPIRSATACCKQALALGLSQFDQLTEYVRLLPYGRTSLAEPQAVLIERRGTCSSKHQLLAAVAHECERFEIKLTVGIYEMSEQNTPGVGQVLSNASLLSIPEAHCYLTVDGARFDFTGLASGSASPFESLLAEHVVAPGDLPHIKPRLHKEAVAVWAAANGMAADDVWAIREACIAALAANQ